MRIGDAAAATGVSAKMIRYYESIGLVPQADRRGNTYRDYDETDLHRLGFIRRARDLGFPVPRIRSLLQLWSDGERSNAEVKAIAQAQVAELERAIADLRAMADVVARLARSCDGSGRPDCPILDDLAAGSSKARAR